ncbi:MAG: hypothetical protein NW204_10930 [Xanthomonadaceae bacterium]|nr:hypothetical protein [Xanthomonadaceae bacterium]
MKRKQIAWMCAMAVAVMGCSAHSPFILKSTTDVKQASATTYESHSNRIYVTRAALPPTAKYEVLGDLEVGKVWYGSSGKVLVSLADGARKLGADAVVEVKTWHQPSGWSWAAPHGSGKAIKITEPTSVDLASLEGEWK